MLTIYLHFKKQLDVFILLNYLLKSIHFISNALFSKNLFNLHQHFLKIKRLNNISVYAKTESFFNISKRVLGSTHKYRNLTGSPIQFQFGTNTESVQMWQHHIQNN